MKRGEVYWAMLAPRSGSEQQGRRPVIIVSRDGFNRVPTWRSVIVVPISTSASQGERGPTAVLLPAKSGGLKKTSIAVCHQVTTLDRAKLDKLIGVLSQDLMQQVDSGIKAALDLV
jgi:mRNA interferase MazF